MNEIIEQMEAAAVTFLTAVKQNKSLPKSFREEIPKVVEEYKKANNAVLEKMEQRLLKMAETEEDKKAIRKEFEEEKTK